MFKDAPKLDKPEQFFWFYIMLSSCERKDKSQPAEKKIIILRRKTTNYLV